MGLSLLLSLIYLALFGQGIGKEHYLESSTTGTSWGAGSGAPGVPRPAAASEHTPTTEQIMGESPGGAEWV